MEQLDISTYLKANKRESKTSSTSWMVATSFLKKEINLFGNSFSSSKKLQFYSDLSSLLQAGVDLSTALELLTESVSKKVDKTLIVSIKDKVIEGSSFSQALRDSGKFSPYEYFTLRIGEETGQLIEILGELAVYYAEKIKLRKKLTTSLSYPMVVLITAFGVIWFMISFIVPMFEDVFQRFGQDLPAITKLIIRISHGAQGYFGVFIILLISFLIFRSYFKKQEWYRRISSRILLAIPLFGGLFRKVSLSRFSLCMYLLLRSRTPLVESIRLVRDMVQLYPLQQALDQIGDDILHGSSLHKSMEKFRIFDKRMISMIKVAEETNRIDLIFQTLKDQYNAEIEQKTTIMGNTLEPILIIFIGLFVGTILVAMYLPMFKLSTSLGF